MGKKLITATDGGTIIDREGELLLRGWVKSHYFWHLALVRMLRPMYYGFRPNHWIPVKT
jgi:hypothetical protein